MDQPHSEFASRQVFHQPLARPCSGSTTAKFFKIPLPTMEARHVNHEAQCDSDGRLLFLLLRLRPRLGVDPTLGSVRIPSGLGRRWLLWAHQYFRWKARGGPKGHPANGSGFGRTPKTALRCRNRRTGAILCQRDARRLGRTEDRRPGVNHPNSCRPHRQSRILLAPSMGSTSAATRFRARPKTSDGAHPLPCQTRRPRRGRVAAKDRLLGDGGGFWLLRIGRIFCYRAECDDISRSVAEQSLGPHLRAHPDALVVAHGTSCRHQVTDVFGRETISPTELLARSLA